MTKIESRIMGMKELRRAMRRSPRIVVEEADTFLTRGMAAYKRTLNRNPWEVGGNGGGVPVQTGNLRDSHFPERRIGKLARSIGPSESEAPYAKYVHGNKAHPVKVSGKNLFTRPWLDYTKRQNEQVIEKLYRAMLTNIRDSLAK